MAKGLAGNTFFRPSKYWVWFLPFMIIGFILPLYFKSYFIVLLLVVFVIWSGFIALPISEKFMPLRGVRGGFCVGFTFGVFYIISAWN